MKGLVIRLTRCQTTFTRLLGHGGAKFLVAENLLVKQQLLILVRHRQRNLCRYSVESLKSLCSLWTYGRAMVLTNRSTACETIRPISSMLSECP